MQEHPSKLMRGFSQGWHWIPAPWKAKLKEWAWGGAGRRSKFGLGGRLFKTSSLWAWKGSRLLFSMSFSRFMKFKHRWGMCLRVIRSVVFSGMSLAESSSDSHSKLTFRHTKAHSFSDSLTETLWLRHSGSGSPARHSGSDSVAQPLCLRVR